MLCAIGPDASNVGNLMRFRVRPERTLRKGSKKSHPTFHCIFKGPPRRSGARPYIVPAYPSVWSYAPARRRRTATATDTPTGLDLTSFTGPLGHVLPKHDASPLLNRKENSAQSRGRRLQFHSTLPSCSHVFLGAGILTCFPVARGEGRGPRGLASRGQTHALPSNIVKFTLRTGSPLSECH